MRLVVNIGDLRVVFSFLDIFTGEPTQMLWSVCELYCSLKLIKYFFYFTNSSAAFIYYSSMRDFQKPFQMCQ